MMKPIKTDGNGTDTDQENSRHTDEGPMPQSSPDSKFEKTSFDGEFVGVTPEFSALAEGGQWAGMPEFRAGLDLLTKSHAFSDLLPPKAPSWYPSGYNQQLATLLQYFPNPPHFPELSPLSKMTTELDALLGIQKSLSMAHDFRESLWPSLTLAKDLAADSTFSRLSSAMDSFRDNLNPLSTLRIPATFASEAQDVGLLSSDDLEIARSYSPSSRLASFNIAVSRFKTVTPLSPLSTRKLERSINLGQLSVPEALSIPPLDGPPRFDHSQHHIILLFEQRVRRLIESRLEAAVGKGWVRQCVPDAIRARWEERQDSDRSAGRPVFHLIQYADFMDLLTIMIRNDNWKSVFGRVFCNRKEDLRVSFERLGPIRNAVAHNRPLTEVDLLTLNCEARRILRTLESQDMHGAGEG